MSLHVQFMTFGLMFACGFGMGIGFDICRVLTGQLRLPRWTIPLVDLLYWTASTAGVFRVLVYGNKGEVRFFVFIGLAAGLLCHYLWASKATVLAVQALIRAIHRLMLWLYRMVQLLIITPIRALYKLLILLLGFLAALSVFFYKLVIQLIYSVWLVVYWLIKPLIRLLPKPQWLKRTVRRLTRGIGRIIDFFRRKT
jgi:spore cortex biosynthesis protein YabQ